MKQPSPEYALSNDELVKAIDYASGKAGNGDPTQVMFAMHLDRLLGIQARRAALVTVPPASHDLHGEGHPPDCECHWCKVPDDVLNPPDRRQ